MKITVKKIKRLLESKYGYSSTYLDQESEQMLIKYTRDVIKDILLYQKGIKIK